MIIKVERFVYSEASTIGRLFIDDKFHSFTLEPVFAAEDVKPRAIPEGTYPLIKRWSNKHERFLPGVEDVPGFADIEMHPGNFPRDTDGCTLVGMVYTGDHPDFIGESQIAFDDIYAELERQWASGAAVTITYTHRNDISNN